MVDFSQVMVAVPDTCMSALSICAPPRAASPPVDLLCLIADWVPRKVCLDRRDSALGCTCPDMSQKNSLVSDTALRA